MSKCFLLARTPRAGNVNYRLLVSSGSNLDERAACQKLEEALKTAGQDSTAIGPSFFMACKRGVMQAATARSGDEVLLLGNVNQQALKEQQRDEFLRLLKDRLEDLKELIDRTDWDRVSGILVERSEFDDWLRKEFAGVASASFSWASAPVPWASAIRWMTAALVLLAALGVAGMAIRNHQAQLPSAPAPTSKAVSQTPGILASGGPSQQFDALLDRWKISRDKQRDALEDLTAIANPGGKADDIWKSEKVQNFLKEASQKSAGSVDPYFFVKAQPIIGSLRELAGKQVPLKAVPGVRGCLAKLGRKLEPCRKFTRNLDTPQLAPDDYPWIVLARILVGFCQKKSSDGNELGPMGSIEAPVLPLFSTRDVRVAFVIQEFLDENRAALENRGIHTGTVPVLLRSIKDQSSKIRKDLEVEREKYQATTPKPENEETVSLLRDRLVDVLGVLEKIDLKPLDDLKPR